MGQTANFNFTYDMSPVILWQYQDAPILKTLILNQENFLNTAIGDYVASLNGDFLNITTASTDGLAMWGQLLQVPRPVYTDEEGNTVSFSDDQYRLLLRARIYLLTFDGSAKALNSFFQILFPELSVVITDNYDMTVTINILNDPVPEIATLFKKPYIDYFLPRPAGVEYIINLGSADYSKIFGFEGMTAPTVSGGTEQLPGFGSDDGSSYDPETSPGGTFYQ